MSRTLSYESLPQHFVLEDVSWELYKTLLRETGHRNVRITYDRGRLELVSPLPKHEKWKSLIGRLIEVLSMELRLPVAALGSTTFKRKKLRKGLEPDECYYIANEAAVRSLDRIDLRKDPPPDLVVEIDVTYRAIKREVIYAAMGVPEVWKYDRRGLTFLKLDGGKYRRVEASLWFPWLRPEDVERFLRMLPEKDQTSVVLAWRDWVRAKIESGL